MMSQLNYSVALPCYPEIKVSDWLKIVMRLATSNQTAFSQYCSVHYAKIC